MKKEFKTKIEDGFNRTLFGMRHPFCFCGAPQRQFELVFGLYNHDLLWPAQGQASVLPLTTSATPKVWNALSFWMENPRQEP